LFARVGFTATTLSTIADAADVSPRTVSTYFPSKEGIVFAIYPEAIGRLARRLEDREPGAKVLDVVAEWGRAEASLTRGAVDARMTDGTDFARLRQLAIARDPELWALERRHVRPMADMLTAAFADELGEPPDSLLARIAGETTAVALMEANARAARGAETFEGLLEVVLGFIRGGVRAVAK
jgi:AcrR family transcriptional regulator